MFSLGCPVLGVPGVFDCLPAGCQFIIERNPPCHDLRVLLQETLFAHLRTDPVIMFLADRAEDQTFVQAEMAAIAQNETTAKLEIRIASFIRFDIRVMRREFVP